MKQSSIPDFTSKAIEIELIVSTTAVSRDHAVKIIKNALDVAFVDGGIEALENLREEICHS